MIKHISLFPAILMIAVTLGACGANSAPEAGPVGSGPPNSQIASVEPEANATDPKTGSDTGEQPASADAPVAPDTAQARFSVSEIAAPPVARVEPQMAPEGESSIETTAATMPSFSR